jgi:hypothetical protein
VIATFTADRPLGIQLLVRSIRPIGIEWQDRSLHPLARQLDQRQDRLRVQELLAGDAMCWDKFHLSGNATYRASAILDADNPWALKSGRPAGVQPICYRCFAPVERNGKSEPPSHREYRVKECLVQLCYPAIVSADHFEKIYSQHCCGNTKRHGSEPVPPPERSHPEKAHQEPVSRSSNR